MVVRESVEHTALSGSQSFKPPALPVVTDSIETIKQASYVVLSFLHFLSKTGTNIYKITRQDICAFVEHEQDRGLKANSVISNLRNVYTFLNFLVEQQIQPQAILSKKIHLKLPDSLPRAIPPEHVTLLLSATSNTRNRTLILLLLRTGLRIGELLNVKVPDIILQERKILIYLAEKTDQGRVVYFSSDADTALQEWLKIRNQQKDYQPFPLCPKPQQSRGFKNDVS
jgi:integrase/recombinase XerD